MKLIQAPTARQKQTRSQYLCVCVSICVMYAACVCVRISLWHWDCSKYLQAEKSNKTKSNIQYNLKVTERGRKVMKSRKLRL